MIVYYTQFSKFAERYGKPCTPVLVGTSSYVYDAIDTQKERPSEARAEYYSKHPNHLAGFRGLFVIDIEHLDMTKPESIAHLKQAVKMYRVRNPGLRIGLYSIMPKNAYYAAVIPEWQAEKLEWRKHNAALRNGFDSLASSVDFVVPHLYQPHAKDADNWGKYAAVNITEASRYGKPIIPICWPFFEHDPGQPYVGDDMVRRMVDMVRTHRANCEGILWWSQASNQEPKSFWEVLNN